MIAHLRTIVFAVWTAIHPLAPRAPDAPVIADGIAVAVAEDELPALTGSREGDAALLGVYAYGESSLRMWDTRSGQTRCRSGDGGVSLGPLQIQGISPEVACAPADAARIWLEMARASMKLCAALPLPERLANLAGGHHCTRGRRLVRWRWEQAGALLAQVAP